jgi:glycosyltransferase involved in cell wall biosynthesis
MPTKSVLMVDPGNYTPYYDVNLCDALVKQGWTVEWLTSPYVFERIDAPSNLCVRHLFLRRVVTMTRNFPSFVRRGVKAASYPFDLARLDRELASRPAGVLHVQWALFPKLDAIFWKRWQKKGWRIVYTAHDVDGLDGTTPRLLVGANRHLFRLADAVATHSERDRVQVIQSGAVPARVMRVPQGTPGLFQQPVVAKDEARRALGLDPERPTILFFGLLKAYKGLEVLLSSLVIVREQIPNVLLLIVGKPLETNHDYTGIIARLGLGGSVRWERSYVPSRRVGLYFASADVVAMPYRAASASAVLLNAYAHSRPVVATTVGGFPEMVEEGYTGFLVPPGDPDAFASRLVALLSKPELAIAMGEHAKQHALQHHEWSLIGRLTSDMYGIVAKRRCG